MLWVVGWGAIVDDDDDNEDDNDEVIVFVHWLWIVLLVIV